MQNKLDDLFSLTTFLRFYPVDNDSNARRYILDPLGRKDPQVLADLRSIMTTVALRRSQVADQTRRRFEHVQSVVLSSAERGKYREILSHAKALLDQTTRSNASNTLLGSLLRLRQICSHGLQGKSSRITDRTTRCSQCGDVLYNLPKVSKVVRIAPQDRLCYDCELAAGGNIPIPIFGLSSFAPSGQKIDHFPPGVNSSMETRSPDTQSSTDDCMNQDEPASKTIEQSSKLEKVVSNLLELRQNSDNSQIPIKRWACAPLFCYSCLNIIIASFSRAGPRHWIV